MYISTSMYAYVYVYVLIYLNIRIERERETWERERELFFPKVTEPLPRFYTLQALRQIPRRYALCTGQALCDHGNNQKGMCRGFHCIHCVSGQDCLHNFCTKNLKQPEVVQLCQGSKGLRHLKLERDHIPLPQNVFASKYLSVYRTPLRLPTWQKLLDARNTWRLPWQGSTLWLIASFKWPSSSLTTRRKW